MRVRVVAGALPGFVRCGGWARLRRDADIYFPLDEHDADQRGRLLATIGDPANNLRTGLRRMAEEGLRVDLVVMACLKPLDATQRAALDRLCEDRGLPAPHVFSRDWFVRALVAEPYWRQRLLGIHGQLEALLDRPLDALDSATPTPDVMGRDSDISTLRGLINDHVDVLLVGVPGVGKTRLVSELDGAIWYLQPARSDKIVDAVLYAQPDAIVVDDAHTRLAELRVLRRLRIQEQLDFSIIATTWPDQAEDVCMELPRAHALRVDLLERSDMDTLVRSVG